MMRRTSTALLIVVSAGIAGCNPVGEALADTDVAAADQFSGSPAEPFDDGDQACPDIAGTWKTRGTCGLDECVIEQSGCNVNFACDDGAASLHGRVRGKLVTFTGLLGSCKGTIKGKRITGRCSSEIASCRFRATR